MRKSCILLLSIIALFWSSAVDVRAQGQEGYNKDGRHKRTIEEVALEISAIRGLEFETPVQHGTKSREELHKYLKKLIKEEIPKEKMLADQKALAKLGLIPADMQLEDFLLELYTEQVEGFYDWHSKTLYLVDGVSETLLKPIISHELTHALQDQFVGISNLPILRENENDDQIMATQALLEGDAVSTMIDYVLKPTGQDSTMLPDIGSLIEKNANTTMSGTLMTTAPAYIRDNILFPYTHGPSFIQRLREAGGWNQVDMALERPPGSTEQIMHPEKYIKPEEADQPSTITLSPMPDEFGRGWTFLGENTLGEFSISILLKEFLEAPVEEVFAGWDGDLYQVYEHEPTGKTALVWLTTWDSNKDAHEFFNGYAALLARKYGSQMAYARNDALVFLTRKGASQEVFAYIELKDKDVLILDGVPDESMDAVRESAWKTAQVARQ